MCARRRFAWTRLFAVGLSAIALETGALAGATGITSLTVAAADPFVLLQQGGGGGGGGGGAAAAASGAKDAAEIVFKAIEGLSAWVQDQSDDAVAAALAATWGNDCNTDKIEDTDTGYLIALATASTANACGNAFGDGVASESLVGQWAGSTIRVEATAHVSSPHSKGDSHTSQAIGKAGIDGKIKTKTQETPRAQARSAAAPTSQAWAPGDIVAELRVSDFSLDSSAAGTGAANSSWLIRALVDDEQIFYSAGSLDHTGNLMVTGDIDRSLFSLAFDPSIAAWTLSLTNFMTEVFITNIGMDAEAEFAVLLEQETNANAHVSSPDVPTVPEPGTLLLLGTGLAMVSKRRHGTRGRGGRPDSATHAAATVRSGAAWEPAAHRHTE